LKKLQLILTNPCAQEWDHMQPAGAGRYCDSCEKHIVDLSNKTDAELIQFFKKKKDNVCGRLLSSQLNRELVVPRPKASWHWLLPLAMGAIAITPAEAKELKPMVVQNGQAFTLPPALVDAASTSPAAIESISGKVIDEQTGEPLKGVKIRRKGFENVVALTDSTGKFELAITPRNMTSVLTFELNGYSKVEVGAQDRMVVKLSEVRTVILGGISTINLNQEPLYLVYAGKKSCTVDASRFKEIPTDWIEKLEILKDAKATALYGSKAANGVILIEIKKAYAKKIDFSKKK
jgi:TonB-dependent SusC/RagA subfamily outer membrane receptor